MPIVFNKHGLKVLSILVLPPVLLHQKYSYKGWSINLSYGAQYQPVSVLDGKKTLNLLCLKSFA